MAIRFTVNHKIYGAPRPRFRRYGGTYFPKWYYEVKELIAAAYLAAGGVLDENPSQPKRVQIECYRALPKSKQRKTRNIQEPDIYKPDVDNIEKVVFDALNGVAWIDDSQIVSNTTIKHPRAKRDDDCDVMVITIEDVGE